MWKRPMGNTYLCQLDRKGEFKTWWKKKKRKFSTNLQKAKEGKQKYIKLLKQKSAEHDSEIFHLEKQLSKKWQNLIN